MIPDPSSLASDERLQEIRARLASEGRVSASVLARHFAVSEDTVRRDLRALAARGECERVYGGAVRRAARPTTLKRRLSADIEEKRRLGRLAADLVEAGETVFIDAGSTNLEIARALRRRDVTVVTNAPAVAEALGEAEGIAIHLVGGRFDPQLGACMGAATLRELESILPTRAFLGTCGLSPETGLTAFSAEEALLKRIVAERARAVVVAVTREKLGLTAPFRIAGTEVLTHLVTSDPENALVTFLAEAGVTVVSETSPQSSSAGPPTLPA